MGGIGGGTRLMNCGIFALLIDACRKEDLFLINDRSLSLSLSATARPSLAGAMKD